MACENIIITIEETNEIVEIIVNDFTVSNILSNDVGNSAVLGTDGKVFVPTSSGGVENHSELNLDDGTNPHGTTKSDVGLGNANNTSDADKPISNATQTALNLKQDVLTATNFGTFSNSLTTEDTIPDAGVFNYTNILGLQVKTTWANIKAKLSLLYQSILVSGTNIKTINGTSILGSGNLATDTQSYKTISGNVTIDDTYHNCIVRVTANATITFSTGLRSDWNAVFDVAGAFTATFTESGTTFSAPFGKKLLTDKMGSIYMTSSNNFRLNGGFSV